MIDKDVAAFLSGLYFDGGNIRTEDDKLIGYISDSAPCNNDEEMAVIVTACHAYGELLRDPMTAVRYIQRQGYHDVAQYYEEDIDD